MSKLKGVLTISRTMYVTCLPLPYLRNPSRILEKAAVECAVSPIVQCVVSITPGPWLSDWGMKGNYCNLLSLPSRQVTVRAGGVTARLGQCLVATDWSVIIRSWPLIGQSLGSGKWHAGQGCVTQHRVSGNNSKWHRETLEGKLWAMFRDY